MKKLMPWIVCFSASLFFAYELLQLHVMNPISPMLIQELGLSATQFGSLSATYLLADVIFLLPAGSFSIDSPYARSLSRRSFSVF